MAAIDDLIAKVEDASLRQRLKEEADNLARQKKFGLVYEKHIPELTPIYNAKVRIQDRVALRDKPFDELWRVKSVARGKATCSNEGGQQVFPEKDLVVVRQFGEPVFPVLTPIDKIQNGPPAAPWHTLIEADNYHALQLLEYLYFGQIDCIYIDPPYNTGARDWKYNNDYVDANDSWRHSKWLSFMEKRLLIARGLLKDDGVLILTIDRVELCHVGVLLEELFPLPQYEKNIVTIVIHGRGTRGTNFSRTEEYAFFLTKAGEKTICRRPLGNHNSLKRQDDKVPYTRPLLRTGNSSTPAERPGQYYPIWINTSTGNIIEIGENCLPGDEAVARRDALPIYPTDSRGNKKVWRANPETAKKALEEGDLKIVQSRNGWTPVWTNYKLLSINHRTVWKDPSHSAATHGTALLNDILGGTDFKYPKSLYATRDCIAAVVANRKEAKILDFFAGSGTTLHAVNLINAFDDGARSCIMVTNNEVSAQEEKEFREKGLRPGDAEWEQAGICRSVTWPRSKYTILGKRDDGTLLGGGYATGKTIVRDKKRRFKQISAVSADKLKTLAAQRELASLIGGFQTSAMKSPVPFLFSSEKAIIFDASMQNDYVGALQGLAQENAEKITNFYIATPDQKRFREIKNQIEELIGSYKEIEEQSWPMPDGFSANLEYFRLDFLDKNYVRLGRQFHEILPLLWLRSGGKGKRPRLPKNKPLPPFIIQKENSFAVLLEAEHFNDFIKQLSEAAEEISHIFLVTDSDELFQEMAGALEAENVVQLYKDYLENFTINKGGKSA